MLLMVPDGIFQNIQVIVGHWRHPTRHLLCSSEILQVRAKPGRARAFLERHQTPFTSSHVASDRKNAGHFGFFLFFCMVWGNFYMGKPVENQFWWWLQEWFPVDFLLKYPSILPIPMASDGCPHSSINSSDSCSSMTSPRPEMASSRVLGKLVWWVILAYSIWISMYNYLHI